MKTMIQNLLNSPFGKRVGIVGEVLYVIFGIAFELLSTLIRGILGIVVYFILILLEVVLVIPYFFIWFISGKRLWLSVFTYLISKDNFFFS